MRGGNEFHGWTTDRYLLATIVDAINQNTYVLQAAHSNGKKPKEPEPVPRPDKAKRKSNNMFAAMAKAKLAEVQSARKG